MIQTSAGAFLVSGRAEAAFDRYVDRVIAVVDLAMKCKHCRRSIRRWDEASLQLGREVYVHDDLVDVDCNGLSCQRDVDTEAEPLTIEPCEISISLTETQEDGEPCGQDGRYCDACEIVHCASCAPCHK